MGNRTTRGIRTYMKTKWEKYINIHNRLPTNLKIIKYYPYLYLYLYSINTKVFVGIKKNSINTCEDGLFPSPIT